MTTIYEAMNAVMVALPALGKTEVNAQFGYNFRGVDGVVNAVGPLLREQGVIVVPNVQEFEYSSIEVGSHRTPMGHARVIVTYTFWGPEGDHIVTSAAGEAMDSGDKATPKAMSVAFRTALLQALCLPTHEPDPDAQNYERAASREQALNEARGAVWEASKIVYPDLNDEERRGQLRLSTSSRGIDTSDPVALQALAEEWQQSKQEGKATDE
jgi:hypothetical protein